MRRIAGLGFEPRYSAPKANVLPLDDPAIIYNARELYNIGEYLRINDI